MSKPGMKSERRKNPYYRDGKYWPSKSTWRKSKKSEELEKKEKEDK
jgi:hypothetical protein